jgi:exopolysaccharide biosynthesis protein
MRISIFLLFFVCFTMSSCKKYDEGGFVYKTEKNLKTSWTLEKYLRNSVDETSDLKIKNYEETYADAESYIRSYINKDGEKISEEGKWSFDKEAKEINISGVSSLKIETPETSTVSSSYYKILKLDDNELWYYFENGGDTHEFHLIKK